MGKGRPAVRTDTYFRSGPEDTVLVDEYYEGGALVWKRGDSDVLKVRRWVIKSDGQFLHWKWTAMVEHCLETADDAARFTDDGAIHWVDWEE